MLSHFFACLIALVPAIQAATISISPALTTATVGQTINLDVTIDNVSDLYGYQFDIQFDRTILQANSITEGGFLAGAGPTLFLAGAIDNSVGSIFGTAGSLESAISGASGAGILARFSFTAIGAGSNGVVIDASSLLLLDSSLSGIIAGVSNAQVAVSATPEPSYSGPLWFLVLAGLLWSRGGAPASRPGPAGFVRESRVMRPAGASMGRRG